MDPFLDKAELERLTCRKKATAQLRMLDRMDIPYVVDGEGWPLVQRQSLYLEPKEKQGFTPNFDALRGRG